MAKLKLFLVEVIAFLSCLFIGAAVFQALEYNENEPARHPGANSSELLTSVVQNISQKYNISSQDLNSTVKELRRMLMRREGQKWSNWDFTGCYFFAGTVAFTIGFGHQTPQTSLGQLMVIIYAMIAIPITGLMLSACGERMAEQQKDAVIFLERRIFNTKSKYLKAKTVAMNFFVLILFFLIGSLMTRYYYDGWSIIEGLYFLWICMTTVGFGDYVVNDGNPYYEGDLLKTIMLRFNVLLLVIGLCQVSCILVSIQDALETKIAKKVDKDKNNENSNGANESEGSGARNDDEIGQSNEACELEVAENGKSCNVSAISVNTL